MDHPAPPANAQRAQERMAVCSACEHLTAAKFCGKCGCFMPIKTFVPWAKCPAKKWS